MSHQQRDREIERIGVRKAAIRQQLDQFARKAGKRRVAAAVERAKVMPLTDRQREGRSS
jgi:hypothetical protein